MTDIRLRAIYGLKQGDRFTVRRTFSEADTLRFGDISRDYNPVHYEDRFCAAKRLPARICHGLLVASLVTEIGGQIGWLASGMRFRFRKPVYFGETVTCTMTITEVTDTGHAHAEAAYHNQDGALVLEAVLTGYLPEASARSVMQTMHSEGDPTNKRR